MLCNNKKRERKNRNAKEKAKLHERKNKIYIYIYVERIELNKLRIKKSETSFTIYFVWFAHLERIVRSFKYQIQVIPNQLILKIEEQKE